MLNKKLIEEFKESTGYNLNEISDYNVDKLVNFLMASHRSFLNKSIPKIEQNFLLIIKHYQNNNNLKIILNLFIKFQIDFMEHIQIEEKTIFPYSRTIYKASIDSSIQTLLLVHFSKYSINDFLNNHKNTECFLSEILYLLSREVDLKNEPLYNILTKQIRQLDHEIKSHAWVEDNILVNKVRAIEIAVNNFIQDSKNS